MRSEMQEAFLDDRQTTEGNIATLISVSTPFQERRYGLWYCSPFNFTNEKEQSAVNIT